MTQYVQISKSVLLQKMVDMLNEVNFIQQLVIGAEDSSSDSLSYDLHSRLDDMVDVIIEYAEENGVNID